MMRTLGPFLIVLLLAASPATASIVVGCAEDGGSVPPVTFSFLSPDGRRMAVFNSSVDTHLRLPNHLQKQLPDGAFFVRYDGQDRRPDYDRAVQMITLHFKDSGPLKAAHADGDVSNIEVDSRRPVQLWNGLATYLTMFGTVNDALPNTESCFWFCDIEIEWVEEVTFGPSWGSVKALYGDAPSP